MAYVVIQHKIRQWSEFERIFTDDLARRKRLGSKGGQVFRTVDDPDTLYIVFEWGDVAGAEEFANGLETHEAMKWATSGIWSRVDVLEKVMDVEA